MSRTIHKHSEVPVSLREIGYDCVSVARAFCCSMSILTIEIDDGLLHFLNGKCGLLDNMLHHLGHQLEL